MDTVELQTCYWWYCNNCATKNYCDPIAPEFIDNEQEDAYRVINGLEDWQELPEGWENFEMICIPETVICTQCKTEFLTSEE